MNVVRILPGRAGLPVFGDIKRDSSYGCFDPKMNIMLLLFSSLCSRQLAMYVLFVPLSQINASFLSFVLCCKWIVNQNYI
jgi:hypothetical protein